MQKEPNFYLNLCKVSFTINFLVISRIINRFFVIKTGIRFILENPSSLSDPACYHEFCRLLARLKSNYQLTEIVKVEGYPGNIIAFT